MTAIFRSPPVQYTLAFLIWAWMALITRTVRWTVENEDEARRIAEAPGPLMVAAWHSRIMLMPSGWTRYLRKWRRHTPEGVPPGAMLISHSRDGEFVARAIKWLGLMPIRGSSANRRKRKNKGGMQAIREASEILRAGGGVCLTPDGPRGPRQRASMGAILLARRTGTPILIYGLASSPARRMKTWDRFIIPVPFGRGAIVFGGALEVSRDADGETLRQELEDRLNAANARAEEIVGLKRVEPAALHETREQGAQAVKMAME